MFTDKEIDKIKSDLSISSLSRAIRRDPLHYQEIFGYTPEYLKGKLILEVGAGDSYLGQGIARLDPSYHDESPEQKEGIVVTAVAQCLPFKDDTFDETVASFSLCWIETGSKSAVREMIRVTKPGGKIKIYPIALRVSPDYLIKRGINLAPSAKYEGRFMLEATKDLDAEKQEQITRILLTKINYYPKHSGFFSVSKNS